MALSRLAEVPIAPFSRLNWGPGNTIAVQVRTLFELTSAMRDPSVGRIELQRHIGLRGAALPAIAAGRDVTIVGACDNADGPRDVEARSVEDASSRRRLTQAARMNADGRDPYSAYPNAFGDLYGPEAQTLVYKDIAEILNLQRFLNETPPFVLEEHPDWPVYPAVETLHYAWDEDAYDRSKETLYASFERGTRFDARRPIEYFAAGTTFAFGGNASAVGPLGGPGMDVPGNVGAATGAYVVPLADRCVIDGLRESALFTVGDAESPDCRWPAPRARRFQPAQGGAVPAAAAVASSLSVPTRRRWYDDGASGTPRDAEDTRDGSAFAKISTATGSFSPWANDNARTPRPRGPQDPEALGEFRERARRCGRLSLENLVLRGGWSETGGAAALVAGGELRVKDCVVEGHRTGSPPAAAAPWPTGAAGWTSPGVCFAKTPPAAGGTARTPSRRIGSPRTRAITCTTSTRDRCRWTGARGSTAGRGASTPRPRRRAREGERSRRSVIRGAERTIGVYFTTRLPKSVIYYSSYYVYGELKTPPRA